MTKFLKYGLFVLLLALLAWGLIAPNGIRAAIANNAWSLAFIRQYFDPSSTRPALPDPPNTHVHAGVMLARKALREGDLDLAGQSLLLLVVQEDPLAMNVYAETLYQQEKYEEAFIIWEKSGSARTLERKANELLEKKLSKPALQAYWSLYDLNPELFTSSLAAQLRSNEEYSAAITILEKSIIDFPESEYKPSWFRYLGSIYVLQKDYLRAETTYHLGVDEFPNDYKILRDMGMMYLLNTSEYIKAIGCFEKLIVLKPEDVNFYILLGKANEKGGFTDQAILSYQKGLLLDSSNDEIRKAIDRLLGSQ